MLYILYFAFLFMNFLGIVFNKKSKVLTILSWLLIFVIMAGNNKNPDYLAYKSFYDSNENWFEKGFMFFAAICRNFGLNYNAFVLFVLISCFVIVLISIKNFKEYSYYVTFFYMTYLMFFDTIQIRNTIMSCLYTSGLILLSQNKTFKYMILVSIATFFHRGAYALFPFVLIRPKSNNTKFLEIIESFVVIFLFVITFFNNGRIPFLTYIVNFPLKNIISSKAVYFLINNGDFQASLFRQIFYIYIAFKTSKYLKHFSDNIDLCKFADVVFMAVIFSSFAILFSFYNGSFNRYLKMNSLSIFILVSSVITLHKKRYVKGGGVFLTLPYYIVIFIVIVILWLVFSLDGFIISDILENNILLE